MDNQEKNKKVVKLSDVDRKVLLDYSNFTYETELMVTAEATVNTTLDKMS